MMSLRSQPVGRWNSRPLEGWGFVSSLYTLV